MLKYNLITLTQNLLTLVGQIKLKIESGDTTLQQQIDSLEPAVAGKGLSTEDFTTTLKDKVDSTPVIYTGATDPTIAGPVPEGAVWFRTE